MASLTKLAAHLGVAFNNLDLLQSALTHASFIHERPDRGVGLLSPERMEFLGDAVVNFLAADLVFARFPDADEGDLTRLRSALIKTGTLAAFAREFNLGDHLRLNKGEEQSGARLRNALLADTFEAVLGAIYLDQGIDAVLNLVKPLFERELALIDAHGLALDYKSQLQQRIQAEQGITPTYHVIAKAGPEHRRELTVEVSVHGVSLGVGKGSSKQAAAQAAAQIALEMLDQGQRS